MKLNACLTSDAWSNIKNKPIVNYMLISDSLTFFLDSVPTGEQNHNAKWIAQDMERMVDFLAEKVCGAVTDNTTTNQSAWSILKKKYPSLFFQGCASHDGTHWFVKDIFDATKPKKGKNVANYPEKYPFHYLLEFVQKCKDFIQAIGKQKESQQKIHDIITDGKFVEFLDKAIMILNPVDTAVVVFQSDSVPVSQIYQSFANTMKEQYNMMSCLSGAERSYLLQLLQSRLDFLYGDAIGIAYLLDPRFVGEKMTAFERTRVEDLIFDYGSETEQSQQMGKKEEMYLQYTNFVIKANHNKDRKDFRFLMLKKGTKTILQFWLVDGLEFSQLARSCSAGVRYGCAQVPRQRGVFPPWGFVHSKLRSSLGSEKGEEESGVYQNKCFSV
ncbi:hypothetical protein BASA50_006768 [Batrachochytrium salamandrivorans]|uniref:DUF659 domain-containing protein n=1 Tax=Batrachochytrium salamandrivorans TaxID=1357716 RepID=A0ABQ8FC71_9FUNG|nr:hypothetical protein BASA50_006768 [Batrachochytrium salamandrivorans]